MPIQEEVTQAVAVGNLKSISEQPAMLSNLAYANAVQSTDMVAKNATSSQQGLNEVGQAVVSRGAGELLKIGPLEARSAVDVLTDNALAEAIADLKGTLAAFATAPPPVLLNNPSLQSDFRRLLATLTEIEGRL